MQASAYYESRLNDICGSEHVRKGVPMSEYTTFRTGGPADYFLTPSSGEEIGELSALCRRESIPYFILGNGSNLLVSDRGFRGAVIQIDRRMQEISVEGDEIRAQAGALL